MYKIQYLILILKWKSFVGWNIALIVDLASYFNLWPYFFHNETENLNVTSVENNIWTVTHWYNSKIMLFSSFVDWSWNKCKWTVMIHNFSRLLVTLSKDIGCHQLPWILFIPKLKKMLQTSNFLSLLNTVDSIWLFLTGPVLKIFGIRRSWK